MIVQIGVSDISRFNLEPVELGKFSFHVDGRPRAFYKSRREAESAFGRQLTFEMRHRNRVEISDCR